MKCSVEFKTWLNMKYRCYNPNSPDYPRYGKRGVKICDRWLKGDGVTNGFDLFFKDMGKRPSKLHSIDRFPNNGGNYEPTNCRWATKKQQQAHRKHKPYPSPWMKGNKHSVGNKSFSGRKHSAKTIAKMRASHKR